MGSEFESALDSYTQHSKQALAMLGSMDLEGKLALEGKAADKVLGRVLAGRVLGTAHCFDQIRMMQRSAMQPSMALFLSVSSAFFALHFGRIVCFISSR
ncbi:MAG: hypothetical protein WCF19_06255 [Chlamydiales bacterium]